MATPRPAWSRVNVRASASADAPTWQRAPGVAPGGGGARVGEVIVDLPPHPLDLLAHRLREIGVAERRRALGFLRQHGQRRLQPVREIARLGDGAAHRTRLMFEQRVEIVDQRLDLARIVAGHLPRGAGANLGEPPAHPFEWRQRAAHERQPGDHAGNGNHRRQAAVRMDDDDRTHRRRAEGERDGDHREQPERPQDRAEHHPAAQRAQPDHRSTSIR